MACVILECFVNFLDDPYYEPLLWFMISILELEMANNPTECEGESDGLLNVGLEFSSYEDLCSTIKNYEKLHFVTLYKQSSRTIQ